MISFLVAAVVLFLITATVIIFLRMNLFSLGILLIALASSIGLAAYGYYWLTGSDVQYYTPGAVMLAGGVGSLAICSISACLLFSKHHTK